MLEWSKIYCKKFYDKDSSSQCSVFTKGFRCQESRGYSYRSEITFLAVSLIHNWWNNFGQKFFEHFNRWLMPGYAQKYCRLIEMIVSTLVSCLCWFRCSLPVTRAGHNSPQILCTVMSHLSYDLTRLHSKYLRAYRKKLFKCATTSQSIYSQLMLSQLRALRMKFDSGQRKSQPGFSRNLSQLRRWLGRSEATSTGKKWRRKKFPRFIDRGWLTFRASAAPKTAASWWTGSCRTRPCGPGRCVPDACSTAGAGSPDCIPGSPYGGILPTGGYSWACAVSGPGLVKKYGMKSKDQYLEHISM